MQVEAVGEGGGQDNREHMNLFPATGRISSMLNHLFGDSASLPSNILEGKVLK